ncbi:hypothetical protein GIB67_036889 [Kingdonia uniflora]|uniref:Uncharacterized protein n=1 Tax=Kingdonia uniflora TaxID=39325 RepID=A0A7J7LS56_9MAGN|nr:hypothetical protein GIB67_036889 [Kingdonia uniflora]
MATTLGLLNIRSLRRKPLQTLAELPSLSKSAKPNLPKQPQISTFTALWSILSPFDSTHIAILFRPTGCICCWRELGLLEGRTLALVHPLVMGGLFFYTLWLVTPEGTPVALATASPIEAKIQQLTEERKELVKGSYKDRHFNAGSVLLAFGVFEAIGGGVNTYIRTGKLFPGPHLYAGAAITVLWAAAAALVPLMQKGNETARSLHIALNTLNVLLFVWQIPTGLDIVYKVFEFTKWP